MTTLVTDTRPREGDAASPGVFLLEFTCAHCGSTLVTGSQFAGIEASCPKCWRPTRAPFVASHVGSGSVVAETGVGPSRPFDDGEDWAREALIPVGTRLDLEGVPRREGFVARHCIPADRIERRPSPRAERVRREARRRRKRRQIDDSIGSVVGTNRFHLWRKRLSIAAVLVLVVGVTYMGLNGWEYRPPQEVEMRVARQISEMFGRRPPLALPGAGSAPVPANAESASELGVEEDPDRSIAHERPTRSADGLAIRPIEGEFRWVD